MTEDNTVDTVKAAHPWRPIRGCPGRYKLPRTTMSASELLGTDVRVTPRQLASARDPVLVVTFEDGGGLLSYQQDDGRWVHTLNEPEGLRRKLAALGL